MATREPTYNRMPIGQLRRRVRQGDPGAVEYANSAGKKIADLMEPFRRIAEDPSILAPPPPILGEAAMRRLREAKERAAVEREEAMIGELAATRQAVEAAEERADAAEGRERFMVRVTVAATVFGAIGAIAAVVTIVVA